MKKNFILALPIFALTLVGCNDIKAPSFRRYSNEVPFDDFLESIKDSSFDSFFTYENSLQGSSKTASIKAESSYSNSRLMKTNKFTSQCDYSFKYDSNNHRSSFSEKEEDVATITGVDGTTQTANQLNASRQYQLHKFEDEEEGKLISIDKAQKVYYLADGTKDEVGSMAAYKSMSGLLVFSIYVAFYPLLDEETQSLVHFYDDNSIFTVYSYSSEDMQLKNDEGEVYASTTEESEVIFQLDLSKENKISFKYSDTTKISTVYEIDYEKHLKKDLEIKEIINYQSSNYELKDLTINEIDVSEFAFREQDLEDL